MPPKYRTQRMELRHLRYFIAVAEAGSMKLAAESRLHTAQPSLSRQIRDLEQEVGAALFARSVRGVELTAAGRAFLDHARLALTQAEAAAEAARRAARPAKAIFAAGFPDPQRRIAEYRDQGVERFFGHARRGPQAGKGRHRLPASRTGPGSRVQAGSEGAAGRHLAPRSSTRRGQDFRSAQSRERDVHRHIRDSPRAARRGQWLSQTVGS